MKIVGVTSCPSGVAHTYMAAEALEQSAKKVGVDIKVETQGSSGAENQLTSNDVANANFVVLTNDTNINGMERFKGKKVVQLSATQIIEKADAVMGKLLTLNKGELK
ncbi:PTS fructose-like transporter subunit IIB [Liquorilactobacillus mali]|uniref:PTS system fructose-like transporter subunit EIIB n=1 Tax=Liquorilactobacillus mali KCTC 3596 = DSM 20444 TaxID=1046596 RepID=J0L3U9_9LACO|nr:PTS fructose-like transporter subunit IIB [Liquorilactobacillus mali]EJE97942.1 putative PTS system fructose-like transporter subunit EIIB [Liquorilactobacillus mali KCTC 3596 = DSM 20444]KRN09828.1 PTS system fructose-like transporter subunit EIIB [Liquorilactobacillus mali KCTC 3596 = DSM 20444]MDC7953747.1 PTS fructose-like transporter subunit IIB [Liquorilactobacillus mali]QFQ75693.1 PTS fructose-like transporter subunit IIB [Liquorilactobacillus mali]